MVGCICAYCGKSFEREVRNIRNNKTLCSRSCNGKYNSKFSGRGSKKSAISNEIVTMILDYRKNGLSDYKIAEITGIDRSKVWRIRKEYSIC